MSDRTQKSPEKMEKSARPEDRRPLESFLIDTVSAVDQLVGMVGEPENVIGDAPNGFGLSRRPLPLTFSETQIGYEVRLPFSLKIFFKGGSRIYGIYLPSGSLNVDGTDVSGFGLTNAVADADDWYEVDGAAPGSDVYLNISKSESEGSQIPYEAEVSTSAKSGAKWSFVIAHILATGGILQRVNGTLALGTGEPSITLKGETESSVRTDGDVDVTGVSSESSTSCGIKFTTTASVPPQPPETEGADPTPGVNAKLIADIVDRQSKCAHEGETGPRAWACRTLTFFKTTSSSQGSGDSKGSEGSEGTGGTEKVHVHFLGCADAEIPAMAGPKGKGIGSIEEDSSQSSERKHVYKVMSDEDPAQQIGTFTVMDGGNGRGIGSIEEDSSHSSGRTHVYKVMSDENPAQQIGTFTVTDGEDGDDGTSAGVADSGHTATVTMLSAGSSPSLVVTASGPDTAKVFNFALSIPESSGDGATGTISYIGNIGYNLQTHSFQKRVDTYDLETGKVTEGNWVTIINGQCIAHSSVDHSSVIPTA